MYLTRKQALEAFDQLSDDLMADLESKSKLIDSFKDDSDWAFIIKTHALVESVVTDLILSKTNEPKLRSLIERLPLSGDELGKLKVAKDYELFSKDERRFIRSFSELRNMLVHKIENVNFDLIDFVSSKDKQQKQKWQKDISWFQKDSFENDFSMLALTEPRRVLLAGIYALVSKVSVRKAEIESIFRIKEMAEETTSEVVKKTQ